MVGKGLEEPQNQLEESNRVDESGDVVPINYGSMEADQGVNHINLRDPLQRPVHKLSVKLLETYKHINKVYYEAKAKRLREQKESARGGVHNDGYDDQNYDYILQGDEIIKDRYLLKHRMGKGSFGQVVCAYDQENRCEVAIKIIKSRKPFLVQAKTEIDILTKILEKDPDDERHIVRLLDQFIHRNHQCLVFEILSFNLYELLRNTKFRGVSLNLIRKFSIQLLRALELLARSDVNIIHCDLKPENILLRHPKRSAIKMIDFGSSCYQYKRTYTYIQSRFYRSPEVLLGLSYSQKIDMWSLGCVVVELHTGEPLFGGANQVDQMCRIIDTLGMPPIEMIRNSPDKTRTLFFEKIKPGEENTLPAVCDRNCTALDPLDNSLYVLKRPNKEMPKPRKLFEIIGVYTGGPNGRRATEPHHGVGRYEEFLDFIQRLVVYSPESRASPADLAFHPYLCDDPEVPQSQQQQQQQQRPTSVSSSTQLKGSMDVSADSSSSAVANNATIFPSSYGAAATMAEGAADMQQQQQQQIPVYPNTTSFGLPVIPNITTVPGENNTEQRRSHSAPSSTG